MAPITVEGVLNSRMIAYPFQCCSAAADRRRRRPDADDYSHAVVSYEALPIHFCNLASGTLRL